jgi:hypothetical protein
VPDEPPIYSTITIDFKIRTEPCKLTTIWKSGEDRKPYTGTDANGALAKCRRNAASRNRNRRRLKISVVAGSSRRLGDASGGQRADDRTYISTTARILPRCSVAEPGFSYWVFGVKKNSTHQYNVMYVGSQ